MLTIASFSRRSTPYGAVGRPAPRWMPKPSSKAWRVLPVGETSRRRSLDPDQRYHSSSATSPVKTTPSTFVDAEACVLAPPGVGPTC